MPSSRNSFGDENRWMTSFLTNAPFFPFIFLWADERPFKKTRNQNVFKWPQPNEMKCIAYDIRYIYSIFAYLEQFNIRKWIQKKTIIIMCTVCNLYAVRMRKSILFTFFWQCEASVIIIALDPLKTSRVLVSPMSRQIV